MVPEPVAERLMPVTETVPYYRFPHQDYGLDPDLLQTARVNQCCKPYPIRMRT